MTPLAPKENEQRNNARGCGIVLPTNLVLSSPPKNINDGWKHMVSIGQGWKSLLLKSLMPGFNCSVLGQGVKSTPHHQDLFCQSLLRNIVLQLTNAPVRHNCGRARSSSEVL